MLKLPKSKKCRAPGCTNKFIPVSPFEQGCCFECKVALGLIAADKSKEAREKRARAEKKEKLNALKTKRDFIKELQIVFNSYIRERDKDKPCICCDEPLAKGAIGGGFDAGHYRSVGSAPHLRFNEKNCHGQRKQCNRYGAGRAVDYRLGLINRIGLAAVEELEADQAPRHYTIEELMKLKSYFLAKKKELKCQNHS